MITAGESLGLRYTVATVKGEVRPGSIFGLVQREASMVHGQLLCDVAVEPETVAQVRSELAVLPACPSLLIPREIVLSTRDLPVGVLDRPLLSPLSDCVGAWAARGRSQAVRALLEAGADIARDLSRAHSLGVFHSAISQGALLTSTAGGAGPVFLSGFGIAAFARRLAPGGSSLAPPARSRESPSKPPLAAVDSARNDLVELLRALHDLFTAAKLEPGGGAAAKWTLLRQAALHGEHPALASGEALASTLREISRLDGEDDPRRLRPVTLPPGRDPTVPPREVGSRSVTPVASPSGGRLSPRLTAATVPPPPRRVISRALVVAAGLSVLLVAGAGVVHMLNGQEMVAQGRLRTRRHLPAAASRCEGEAVLPPVQRVLPPSVDEFELGCSPAGDTLFAITRRGTAVQALSRTARRGGALTAEAFPVARGAVDLGGVASTPTGAWFAWRNGVDAPLSLGRRGGEGSMVRPVGLQGWDDIPLRGAAVAWVGASRALLVTNVALEGGGHAMAVELSLGAGRERPPVVTWYIGPGSVDAVIPGERPTVLLHNRAPAGHTFTALDLDPVAITAARAPGAPETIRGAALPPRAVLASSSVTLPGEGAHAAPAGLRADDGTRVFAVTVGAPRARGECRGAEGCVAAGQALALSFPAEGDPRAETLHPRAWADAVLEGPSVLLSPADDAGLPTARRALRRLGAAPGGRDEEVDLHGGLRVRVLRCGAERWAAVDVTAGDHDLAVMPWDCLRAAAPGPSAGPPSPPDASPTTPQPRRSP